MSAKAGVIFYVMGVSGCGKSTIGKQLADQLAIPFFDGDDYHSDANVKKMAGGVPLTDDDRKSWLFRINKLARTNSADGAVIACSALKESYRNLLAKGLGKQVLWVFLNGSFEEILKRLELREGHFMPMDLLRSQFDTLEIPDEAIIIEIKQTPEEIVRDIRVKCQI